MHPFLQLSLQCGFFNAIGSLLAQLILLGGLQNFDTRNFVTMATFGSFVFAPIAYNWYPLLNSMFAEKGIASIIFKVALDQTIGSCMVLMALNFYVTLVNSKGDAKKAITQASQNLFKTLKVNWSYWVPVQAINLAFVPNSYQVLVMNVASIPWNMFISYAVSKKEKEESEKAKKKK